MDVKGGGVLESTSSLFRRNEREWVPPDDHHLDGDDGDDSDDYLNRLVVLNQKKEKNTKRK